MTGGRSQKKRISEKAMTRIYFVLATFFTLILIFPIYWMIISSFKGQAEMFALKPTFWPKEFVLDGYIKMFTQTGSGVPVTTSVKNSLFISLITTVITTVLAVPAAYGLARFDYKIINKLILFMFLVAQMLPQVLFLAPLYIILKRFHILGYYFAPSIFVTLHSLPFALLMLRPYFLSVPKELENSAIIDGCNKFTAFTRIMLPLTYPSIVVVVALSFLWGWGDLMGSLTFISQAQYQPLTQSMYLAISAETINWTVLMAFSTFIVVPAIIVFLSLQKFIIGGLTAGSVKG